MQSDLIKLNQEGTPLFDLLKTICQKEIYSFHALPISSFGHSDILPFCGKEDVFLESTITDEAFDNFFFPKGVIRESQKLTAQIYNADRSFYITGGTSVANQIAITALYDKEDEILIDKNCHQSVHFHSHSQALGANVDYLCPDLIAEDGQLTAWSIEKLTNKVLSKQSEEAGYDLIILTAQSYEGLIYDIPAVLLHLLKAGVKTRKFFIDEAWGSLNYFSDDTRPYTVMNIDSIIEEYPNLEVVCTQSAHKSLFCLRQASLIHCKGGKELPYKIEVAKFRIHTTSPNYAILASLDLAQAYMRQYGNEMASYSRALVNTFKEEINSEPELALLHAESEVFQDHWHIHHDPTKVMLNVTSLGDSSVIKDKLLRENIFVKRILSNHLLLSFHIGINKEAVGALTRALVLISQPSVINRDIKINSISKTFIIPYPPGVPIVFPGDKINAEITQKIKQYEDSGMLVISA
ncbi:lysine decarboxylase [Winslowiella iniecta]|uniref:Lysine decarboxylase n=1 Tax=Winslowiella iniecta TaxID=1560201 RepID=A0A0L7T8I9_9GAMM|nr:lysine decarboxylase [Winslowiella iniecta]KOC91511.1 lysine decarboxylase [Winslowiella iniecta]KOC94538.1 lysine decarboxylase [Winslowiella iniecta]